MEPKKLPRIMYDQSQYTPLWFFDEHSFYCSDRAWRKMRDISGYATEGWICYTQNIPESFWFGAYPEESLEKEAEVGFANFTNKKFVKKFEKAMEDSLKRSKKLSELFQEKFSGREAQVLESEPDVVVQFFNDIRELQYFVMSHYLLTQPQRFFTFEKEIQKYIPNEGIEFVSINGRSLTYVAYIGSVITLLAKEIKESNLSYDHFLDSYPEKMSETTRMVKEFGFLNWGYFGGELVTMAYVKREVESLLNDHEKFETEVAKTEELLHAIEKRNHIVKNDTSEGMALADIMGHASVLRFNLQTCALCVVKYLDVFITEIQKKYNFTKDDINSYYADELIALIGRGIFVDKETLLKRQTGFLRVWKLSGEETFTGEDAHAQINDILEFRLHEIATTKEVRGTIASFPYKNMQMIQGRAYVVTTAYDSLISMKEFQVNDILVATQTHPNLVPQMKNALAIVTDEGGITCHAAIVSRELGKPCVIGTKLATKIFKTGDMIEINMVTGTVRKI